MSAQEPPVVRGMFLAERTGGATDPVYCVATVRATARGATATLLGWFGTGVPGDGTAWGSTDLRVTFPGGVVREPYRVVQSPRVPAEAAAAR